MKYVKIIVISLLSLLFNGCWWNNNVLENYQGSSDARIWHNGKFQNKYVDTTLDCIKNGEKWEIWLEDLKFNQLFEGKVENFFDGTEVNMNELTLSVTIESRKIIHDKSARKEVVTLLDNKVFDFKQGIAKNVSPNADDIFIYSGIADDSDITIKIEVIEYDDHIKEVIDESVVILEDTFNSLNITSFTSNNTNLLTNNVPTKLYDTFKSKIINKLKKNDLVFKHQTTLHACNTIEPNEKAKYFKKGYLTFIRKPSDKNAESYWNDSSLKNLPSSSSYIVFRVLKRLSPVQYNTRKTELEKERKKAETKEPKELEVKGIENVDKK